MDNLRDTEYYDALARIKDSGAGTLFDYDLALDLYYFSTMWKKGKRVLKGHEQKIFLKDYGTKIDLLNLQWIYQALELFHTNPVMNRDRHRINVRRKHMIILLRTVDPL